MEFTAENVEAAVKQFYMSSSGIQAQAHQWLMSAQTSKEAWSFVWPLLRQDTSPEVQFFGATTLQAKVKISLYPSIFACSCWCVLWKTLLILNDNLKLNVHSIIEICIC
jgi:hypothetical protein